MMNIVPELFRHYLPLNLWLMAPVVNALVKKHLKMSANAKSGHCSKQNVAIYSVAMYSIHIIMCIVFLVACIVFIASCGNETVMKNFRTQPITINLNNQNTVFTKNLLHLNFFLTHEEIIYFPHVS